MAPTRIAEAKRLVIKVGSALVTNNGQGLDLAQFDEARRDLLSERTDHVARMRPLMPDAPCDGYWFGRPGLEHAAVQDRGPAQAGATALRA